MTRLFLTRPLLQRKAAWLLAAGCLGTPALAAEPTRTTLEFAGAHGSLTANLPDAKALFLRGTWEFDGGDVLRAEGVDERKFDAHGGIVALGYAKVLSADWILGGTLALGHGGPNWARRRGEVEVSTKWTEKRDIVTRAALYYAAFDGSRSDRGLRLSAVAYFSAPVVVEAGVVFNVSDPGSVNSRMPYASLTYGRDREQYLSVRASSGTEAYQAIGAGQQLVDFRSRSLGIVWRRWIARDWGFTVGAEAYRNPTYERATLGAGLFAQW